MSHGIILELIIPNPISSNLLFFVPTVLRLLHFLLRTQLMVCLNERFTLFPLTQILFEIVVK